MTLSEIFALIQFFMKEVELYLGAGTGAEKKQYVLEAINRVITDLNIKAPSWVLTNMSLIIDILVWFWNKIGAFIKTTKPATTSATK